jgi:hypothetical protein
MSGYCCSQVSVELKPLKVASASSSKDQQTCRTAPDSSSSQPACSTEAGQGAVPSFPPNAGVFTTKEVKQGNMLAVIPVELGYSVRKGIQKLVSSTEFSSSFVLPDIVHSTLLSLHAWLLL